MRNQASALNAKRNTYRRQVKTKMNPKQTKGLLFHYGKICS
jgi:hypothetical protein